MRRLLVRAGSGLGTEPPAVGACRARGWPVPLSFAENPPCSSPSAAASLRGGEKGWPRGSGPPILTALGYGAGLSPAAGLLPASRGDFSLSGRIWPNLGRCFQLWLRVSCLDPTLDMMLSLPGACSGVRSQESICLVFNIAGLLPDFSPCFPCSVLGLVLGPSPRCLDLLPRQPGCGRSRDARVQAGSSLSALVAQPAWTWVV